MLAVGICLVALLATYFATKRSVGYGLIAIATTGYLYGILRANLLVIASHFIFDCALIGMYAAFGGKFFAKDSGSATLRTWVLALIVWPCFLCLAPFQPFLVSLVGLRGNIFFVPILLIGCQLKHKDLRQFSFGLVFLNFLALTFGVLEYFDGIERFFPVNEVTRIMYASGDVAGGHYRIPSLFSSAHAFAGSMVNTLPLLFGAWAQPKESASRKTLLLCGMGAALGGVLLSSTRTHFVNAAFLMTVALFSSKISLRKRAIFVAVLAIVGVIAATNDRFGRFKTLSDSELVTDRINGSVNRSFFEILSDYPLGNGLGGGGTSMPYFLEGQIRNPVASENEYARILAEQGIIGLLIWFGFIGWCMSRKATACLPSTWRPARRLMWFWLSFTFVAEALGNGLLTAIPQTFLFLLCVGWAVTSPQKEEAPRLAATGRSWMTRGQRVMGRVAAS